MDLDKNGMDFVQMYGKCYRFGRKYLVLSKITHTFAL